VDDIQELKPTIVPGVPRVYEKIYANITARIATKSGLAQKLFNKAFVASSKAMRNGKKPPVMWEKLVFSKIKKNLGGRVRMLFCGGAPLNKRTQVGEKKKTSGEKSLKVCVAGVFVDCVCLSVVAGVRFDRNVRRSNRIVYRRLCLRTQWAAVRECGNEAGRLSRDELLSRPDSSHRGNLHSRSVCDVWLFQGKERHVFFVVVLLK
jgi:hypothetical protein